MEYDSATVLKRIFRRYIKVYFERYKSTSKIFQTYFEGDILDKKYIKHIMQRYNHIKISILIYKKHKTIR